MDRPAKTLIYFVVSALILVGLLTVISGQGGLVGKTTKNLRYDEVLKAVNEKKVTSVTWQQNNLSGDMNDGTKFMSLVPSENTEATKLLTGAFKDADVKVLYEGPPVSGAIFGFLSIIGLPIVLRMLPRL